MLDDPVMRHEPGVGRVKRHGSQPIVCVQGLGFVGAAVSVAIASARDDHGAPRYHVIGVDLPTEDGLARINSLNGGEFPFPTTDPKLAAKTREANVVGNLTACADPSAFASASTILVDVPLDVVLSATGEMLGLDTFRAAIATVGRYMRPDALVIIETTVPPGTTNLIVEPLLRDALRRRRLAADEFMVAHSYERVMPGAGYYDSIVNMPRVYAGIDERAACACGAFLRTILDGAGAMLTKASSTTASELGKVLENTYRSVTIALMDEFAGLAENIGVDLFEMVSCIRRRPTHSNMRTPGFGVGGYCLPKDPLMLRLAARDFFRLDLSFPFASLATDVNRAAPLRTLEKLEGMLGGSLAGKRILLLGVSYRAEIGDTRHSPSQAFFEKAVGRGAALLVHDPLVEYWREMRLPLLKELPPASGLDAVVIAVAHQQYRELDYGRWLEGTRPCFLDAFGVLSGEQRAALRAYGCRVESIGRGAGL